MSDRQDPPPPPDAPRRIDPPIFPATPEDEEDIPDRPWLRRTALVIYIGLVICVIIGLIALSFPWENYDLPFDPPFRFRERI